EAAGGGDSAGVPAGAVVASANLFFVRQVGNVPHALVGRIRVEAQSGAPHFGNERRRPCSPIALEKRAEHIVVTGGGGLTCAHAARAAQQPLAPLGERGRGVGGVVSTPCGGTVWYSGKSATRSRNGLYAGYSPVRVRAKGSPSRPSGTAADTCSSTAW